MEVGDTSFLEALVVMWALTMLNGEGGVVVSFLLVAVKCKHMGSEGEGFVQKTYVDGERVSPEPLQRRDLP